MITRSLIRMEGSNFWTAYQTPDARKERISQVTLEAEELTGKLRMKKLTVLVEPVLLSLIDQLPEGAVKWLGHNTSLPRLLELYFTALVIGYRKAQDIDEQLAGKRLGIKEFTQQVIDHSASGMNPQSMLFGWFEAGAEMESGEQLYTKLKAQYVKERKLFMFYQPALKKLMHIDRRLAARFVIPPLRQLLSLLDLDLWGKVDLDN